MDGISIATNTGTEMCGIGAGCSSGQTDSDRESMDSDYSEMADPVKEHLASIHILQEAELRFGSMLGLPAQQPYMLRSWLTVERRPFEDDMQFLHRQKKINFLSLAQEFAAIKQANPDALPFNLHRQRNDATSKGQGYEESVDVCLAQELAAVSCVDKTDDEVSQLRASCLEQVDDCGVYDNCTDNERISQSSDTVTDSCSSSVLCAVEEISDSQLAVMVSSVPDVVQDAQCDEMNSIEADPVNSCRSSDVLNGCNRDFKTSDELTDTVMSHSKNVDLASIVLLVMRYISVSVTVLKLN